MENEGLLKSLLSLRSEIYLSKRMDFTVHLPVAPLMTERGNADNMLWCEFLEDTSYIASGPEKSKHSKE